MKIDKTFVDAIGTDSATHKVTEHIIGMARSLNLLTVAEGIERQDQADYLKAREVDFGQGWLYGKPMPAAEFIKYYLQRGQHAAAATHAGRSAPLAPGNRVPLAGCQGRRPAMAETSWSAAAPACKARSLGQNLLISRDAYRIAAASISWVIADIHELKRSAGTLPIHRLYLGADFPDGRRPGASGKPEEAMKT